MKKSIEEMNLQEFLACVRINGDSVHKFIKDYDLQPETVETLLGTIHKMACSSSGKPSRKKSPGLKIIK